MAEKIIDAAKKWFAANKLGPLGFAVGMAFVLAVAGIYRISWELPESIPTPAPQNPAPVPQRPTPAKPVLKRLDGPPEPLRRLHEQQNKTTTPSLQPNTK